MCHRVDTEKACISIHALLAESDSHPISITSGIIEISIHALLAESDFIPRIGTLRNTHISIHALLAESDEQAKALKISSLRISIHALLAESDCVKRFHAADISYFYPRSPCGERRMEASHLLKRYHFYPRSPCGERLFNTQFSQKGQAFLSTLSLRRATGRVKSL